MMFKVGDKVRVKSSVKEPEYRWGGLRNDKRQIGVVKEDRGYFLVVSFPSQLYWKAKASELERLALKLENK